MTADPGYAIGSTTWPGTSKCVEEIGELQKELGSLQQVFGKLIALGGPIQHWDGTKLDKRLHEECADVYAALDFFLETNGFDLKKVDRRRKNKLKLFRKWHAEQKK